MAELNYDGNLSTLRNIHTCFRQTITFGRDYSVLNLWRHRVHLKFEIFGGEFSKATAHDI